jgi:hypothetical protein
MARLRMWNRRCSRRNAQLSSEHFLQQVRRLKSYSCRDHSKFANEAAAIYGSNLVQGNLSCLSAKADSYPSWIGSQRCGHGRDQDGLQRFVHFVGRHYEAGPGFSYFRIQGRIEADQPNLITAGKTYHFHSSRSNLLGGKSSSNKPSDGRSSAKAFFQPDRIGRCGAMTNPSAVTRSST